MGLLARLSAEDSTQVRLQLNELVELSEFVIHQGDTVDTQSLEKHWPQYARLCDLAREAQATILERFGKKAPVYRVPLGQAFRFKRSFVQGRVAHLTRILSDSNYRKNQLGLD